VNLPLYEPRDHVVHQVIDRVVHVVGKRVVGFHRAPRGMNLTSSLQKLVSRVTTRHCGENFPRGDSIRARAETTAPGFSLSPRFGSSLGRHFVRARREPLLSSASEGSAPIFASRRAHLRLHLLRVPSPRVLEKSPQRPHLRPRPAMKRLFGAKKDKPPPPSIDDATGSVRGTPVPTLDPRAGPPHPGSRVVAVSPTETLLTFLSSRVLCPDVPLPPRSTPPAGQARRDDRR
jgi:hypothetical protein